jgi:ketosteroid isomerase-like protein
VSEQNVELHRRVINAFNASDVEAFVALCDPNVDWNSVMEPGGARYQGHDGVRSWFRDLKDAWGDELRVEIEAYFDLGERTLAFNLLQGRGSQSGAAVEMPVAHVVTWGDGLIVHYKTYAQREDALSELGVSAGELEPIDP